MHKLSKPRKQTTELRQAGLVEAALQLASQRSPIEITTAELAKAVGISQGAVFKHFPSKEAIWLAVLDWTAGALMERLHAAAESVGDGAHTQIATPFVALQAVFHAHVAFVVENPGVPQVLFQELQHRQDTAIKVRVRDIMQQHRTLVLGLLNSAKAQSLLHPNADLQGAAVLLLGSVQGLIMQSMVTGLTSTLREQAVGVFDIFLRGITATPLKESP
jgi:TetR/AcrR family transcriptional regulator